MLSFSVSVSLQMMSPHSGDILSRVILQSDTFLSVSYHPMTATEAKGMSDRLAFLLGCFDISNLSSCLADRSTYQVLLAAITVSVETDSGG